MADQTVEIKLVLRDELSRQLAPLIAQVRQLGSAIDTTRPQQHMERLGAATAGVRRELSTLSQITFGGLIGGGVVAGLVATAKALGDMASRGLQLRYSADALGVSTEMLNKFSDAMMGLGRSRESGASSIEAATKALRELQIEGGQSNLFKQLEQAGGESGKRLAQELAKEIAGPRGLEGGLKYALERMAGMRQESAAKVGEALGLGPGFGKLAAKDLLEVMKDLPKRYELSHDKLLELAHANLVLGISWDNIKLQLAGSILPMFAQLSRTLSEFLQSAAGQAFTKQLEAWGQQMNAALKEWLEGGGLQKLLTELGTALELMKQGFDAANVVITDMGTDWGHVLGGLALAQVALSLGGIAGNLAAIAKIPGVIALLALLGASYALLTGPSVEDIKDPKKRAQADKDIARGAEKPGDPWALWNILKDLLKGNVDLKSLLRDDPILPFPGSGQPKTQSEKLGDAAEKKRATQQLTEQFKNTQYAMAKLNDFLQPGGPEGGKGSSGFQLPYQPRDFTFYYPGASGPKGREGPYETAKRGAGGGDFTPKTLDDLRLGKSPYVTLASAASQLGQMANIGDVQYRSPLDGKVYRIPNVPGYTHDRGGAFTPNRPDKRDIAVGDFRGTNPDTGKPFTDTSSEKFSSGNRQYPPGSFELASTFAQAGSEPDFAANPITNHLATRDAPMNGSATVNIDVGGLNKPERNPYDLFKWQPIGGAVQMQSNPRPENNPLSFQ